METAEPTKVLPSLFTALRHHMLVLVAMTALIMGLAVVYVSTTTAVYTSTAVLLLNPLPGNPLTPEETSSTVRLTVAMETEAGLVTTPGVAVLASESIGRAVPDDDERLQVNVPGGTQMLSISFTGTSGERARDGAQGFAETYLSYREDRARENQADRLERLETQASNAEENLQVAIAAASDEKNSYAVREVEIYTDRLAQLNSDISAVRVEGVESGRVITPAEAPVKPVGIRPTLLLVAAGLGGLILGVLLAMFLEWRRDLIREDDQFDVGGIPVFARLPRWSTPGLIDPQGGKSPEEAATHEAYRRLRAGVVANSPRPHVVGVAAVGEHEHASAVVANLAVVLAEARFTVLLIAADPKSREVESLFGISHSLGLSEVVQEGADPADVIQVTSGISIMAGGADALAARELYAGQAFRSLVERFRDEFDYVLISASGTGTADGDAALGAADSVLLSLTNSRTTHAEVVAALDRFARLQIQPLGAVNVPPASTQRGTRAAAHGGPRLGTLRFASEERHVDA